MLTGQGCFAGTPSKRTSIRAIEIAKNMEFVGIQEDWKNVVILVHAKFGGKFIVNEVERDHESSPFANSIWTSFASDDPDTDIIMRRSRTSHHSFRHTSPTD